jgi:RimJ/RimL family protein N-acetyltransferase
MRDIYRGKLVRLAMEPAEEMAKANARWDQDSEYHRLADSDPTRLWSEKKQKEWVEKRVDPERTGYFPFSIRTLVEDRFIGDAALSVTWPHRDAWLGIVIGEREYWSKGYGTDAMNVLTRYAFSELNLQRVSLSVLAYNKRAMRCYEKAGFQVEGAMRGEICREGGHTDGVYMGILRREWESLEKAGQG